MTDQILVIVAEDIEILREEYCSILDSQNDITVVGSASSGREACERALNTEVDVVLMDIEMEKYHAGIEAARDILLKKPAISIVFLTIHEDEETIFSALSAGAVNYLIKSSSPQTLITGVRNAYQKKTNLNPVIATKMLNEFSRLKNREDNIIFILNMFLHLTPSEYQIVGMLLRKMKVSEIAEARFVEIPTVKSQITTLLKKFRVKRTREIIAMIRELAIEELF